MPIYDYEGYPDNDVEEESNADVLPDPDWEKQQKKTFTAWCNAHLRVVNDQIESIENDFRNGLKLMKLLEVISGERLPKPDRGKMRFHKIANVNKALDFIVSKGVKLVSIGAEEIVDGNVKMTLGMIWTIILRFAIQDIQIEDSSAKEGLLLWCKRQTANYKNVRVDNFHTSFKDGLAFCAIIHRNRPQLLDYDSLTKSDPVRNLNLAFDVAEKHLDIPKMLDTEDMVSEKRADERSVMAYLSSYYHVFSGAQKANIAATRISNNLRLMRETQDLIDKYDSISSDLLGWIKEKLDEFAHREPQTSVAAVENLQQKFRVYHRKEKPLKLQEKSLLETNYNTLQTRLRLNNRPPYVPQTGRLITDISKHWKSLEQADKVFEEWLLNEIQRLENLEFLAKKFEMKCSTHESWTNGKTTALASSDFRSATLSELRAFQKKHEAFQSDMTAHHARIDRIRALAEKLTNLDHFNAKNFNRRYQDIVATWDEMSRLSIQRKDEIAKALRALEEIDQLHLDFAKRAAPFNNWMEQTEEDLCDTFIVHTMSEVERLIADHRTFENTLSDAEKECSGLQLCAGKVKQIAMEYHLGNATINPYTNIQPEDLPRRFNQILELTKKRSDILRNEYERQGANDRLRRDFAQKAEEFNSSIEIHRAEIVKTVMEPRGKLEEQRDYLKQLEKEINKSQSKLNELEQISQALEDAYVFDNPFTVYSMPTLRVSWEQLFTSLHFSVNELENQILTRDSKGLTAEQMNDLRSCFKHFDKNNTGRLEPHEFKACLVSLGHSFRDEKTPLTTPTTVNTPVAGISDSDFARIMREVDPGHTGFVTFDAFLNYMTRENADEATEAQLIHSFKALAGDKGYITAQDIKEYLSAEDSEFCLKHMKRMNGPMGDSGALDFEHFACQICGRNPVSENFFRKY